MSVLKYFKNIPRPPPIGRQALSVIFFLQIRNEVPGKKKALSPVGGATGACRPAHGRPPLGPAHRRGRGPVTPPGRQGLYKRADPPLPSSFEPENSTKNPEKKRGVRRRKAAKPCRIQHL